MVVMVFAAGAKRTPLCVALVVEIIILPVDADGQTTKSFGADAQEDVKIDGLLVGMAMGSSLVMWVVK